MRACEMASELDVDEDSFASRCWVTSEVTGTRRRRVQRRAEVLGDVGGDGKRAGRLRWYWSSTSARTASSRGAG
eukprot:1886545-Rhodomonas_salina.1